MTQPIDRSTAWPYDKRRQAAAVLLLALRPPDGCCGRARLGRARGRRRARSTRRAWQRQTTVAARARAAGDDDRARRGLLLRHLAAPARARALGDPASSSTTRRRAASGGRRRVGRGACEPGADPARLGGVRAHGGLVVCDATVSTPVYLRALDEGADVVVHSATKFLTGSHDALLGATVTRDPEQTARLRDVPPTAATCRPRRRGALLRGLDSLERRMRADHRDGDRARAAASRSTRPSSASATRVRGPHLVRRRATRARSRRDAADHQRDEPRRRGSTMESRHRWEGDRIPVGLSGCRSGSRTSTSSGPTSSRRSRAPRRDPGPRLKRGFAVSTGRAAREGREARASLTSPSPVRARAPPGACPTLLERTTVATREGKTPATTAVPRRRQSTKETAARNGDGGTSSPRRTSSRSSRPCAPGRGAIVAPGSTRAAASSARAKAFNEPRRRASARRTSWCASRP